MSRKYHNRLWLATGRVGNPNLFFSFMQIYKCCINREREQLALFQIVLVQSRKEIVFICKIKSYFCVLKKYCTIFFVLFQVSN